MPSLIRRHALIIVERAGVLVHIGDYMYREEACPANAHELCGGSPFGATFAAWEVDFFEPAVEGLLLHVWVCCPGLAWLCHLALMHAPPPP